MPRDQRREVVAALREEGHSFRAIGGALGVDPKTAWNDAKAEGVEDSTPGLSDSERERLAELEGVIERGLGELGAIHEAEQVRDGQQRVTGLDGKSYPAAKRRATNP